MSEHQQTPMTKKQALATLYRACDALWQRRKLQDDERRLALADQAFHALVVLTPCFYGKPDALVQAPFLCQACYARYAQSSEHPDGYWLCADCRQARETEKEQSHAQA